MDVVITDYGIAINPRQTGPDRGHERCRSAIQAPSKNLRDIAYSIAGEPEKVQFGERVVGIIESRDGTIMDVVREMKEFEFEE